jgi:hypothetical protein
MLGLPLSYTPLALGHALKLAFPPRIAGAATAKLSARSVDGR